MAEAGEQLPPLEEQVRQAGVLKSAWPNEQRALVNVLLLLLHAAAGIAQQAHNI